MTAAFAHDAPAPRSRIRSHFGSLGSRPALNGRILAAFAHSQHSTVAFEQLLPALSILARRWSRIRSHFGSFCSLSVFSHAAVLAYGRILAAFALSPHSRTPRLPPVLAYGRILAASALSYALFPVFGSLVLPGPGLSPITQTRHWNRKTEFSTLPS